MERWGPFLIYVVYLYARFLYSRAHSAKRARDDRVSCIQVVYPYSRASAEVVYNVYQGSLQKTSAKTLIFQTNPYPGASEFLKSPLPGRQ